ncbi:MAG: helicase C-terminal domain-containing protein [Myxococcaceae bacterium]
MEVDGLLNRFAIIDLETTGLDPKVDEVIELGAAFVERGLVVRRISRLFAPSRALPVAIRRITGLDDADLAGQPPFQTYLPELAEALGGWTVVAHNAAFEQSFLAGVLRSIRAPVLDSCELLHYLYPELESHSLESVIRWAGVGDHAAHRALRDCEDTLAVLRYALERCILEGRAADLEDLLDSLRPARLGPLSPAEPGAPLVTLLTSLREACRPPASTLTLTESGAFLPGPAGRERTRAPESRGAVGDGEVEALLGPGGAMEAVVPGFESRPGQLEMARAVAHTLSAGGVLAVEAGTGTGKSLAYLGPAALFASGSGSRVAIAPHTKALQDQLIEKDLPRLHRATGGAFSYAVLKGQGNYLCRRRALEVTAPGDRGQEHGDRAARAYLRAFLRRSPDGDLDRLSYWFKEHYPRLAPLQALVRSEAATTLGERCPHYRRCYYHSAVARAQAADLLVVNQSLALAWPPRYPEVSHLVLDEAHELEDVTTQAFTVEVSDAVLGLIGERLLGHGGRRGLLTGLGAALDEKGAGREGAGLVAEARAGVGRLGDEVVELGEAVLALCELGDAAAHGAERRLDAAVRTTRPWLKVRDAALGVCRELDEQTRLLSVRLPPLHPSLSIDQPALEREVQGVLARALEVTSLLRELTQDPQEGRCYQASARAGGKGWQLASLPLDIAPLFAGAFAADKRALVLTSATLTLGPGRPWVLERLGLDTPERPAALLRLGTSFDLARQALVVLVTDAPSTRSDEFVTWAAARIGGLARFLGGRVLGLFASTARLEAVGEAVRAGLEPLGIEVLRQSRGKGRSLAARQEQDFGSVLLGTRTFWQGIDIPGRGVACVFIDKLPIEPGSRPIVASREERLGGAGRGFSRYRLPRALLLLRQGVGRLIRSADDGGVVVIADPGSLAYRDELLAALEGYRVETLPWSRARLRVREQLESMGLSAARPAPLSAAPPA